MAILAYIIAFLFILITLFFFKVWESGKYFKVAFVSILIRLLLIPVFEIYGDRIMFAELPELLLWYAEWHKYIEIEGFKNIILNPFGIEGPRGMYLYYVMYAGWFLDLTNTEDMIPLRLFTIALSLYIIAFSKYIIEWCYGILPTSKQVFIITNWPFWLLYSVSLGRTMPSVLIPLFGIVVLHKILEKFSFTGLLFVVVTFWITIIFRTFYSFFYFSTFISFFTYRLFLERDWKNQLWKKVGVLVVGTIVIISLANLFNVQDAFSLIVDNLTESDQVEGETSGSAYLISFYPQKYADLLYYMPVQGFYFLLSPMMWDVHKIEQLVSSIFALLLLVFILKMYFQYDNLYFGSKKAKIFFLNMIIISMILGAGVKNAGAAQRWRLPIVSVLLCLVLPNVIKNPKKI